MGQYIRYIIMVGMMLKKKMKRKENKKKERNDLIAYNSAQFDFKYVSKTHGKISNWSLSCA